MKPLYDFGTQVRVTRVIRDDGTFPGKCRGDLLVRKGSIGYVRDVGVILQDQIIYQVHFIEAGVTVGCREQELIHADEHWVESRYEFSDLVEAGIHLGINGEVVVAKGERGQVMAVRRELEPLAYEVLFDNNHLLLVPETALADLGSHVQSSAEEVTA